MSELAKQGSTERNDVITKLRTLTEEQQYELWEEMWMGRHRRTFFTVPPVMKEAPSPPPGAPPPSSAVLTEADLRQDAQDAFLEERPLPFSSLRGAQRAGRSPSPYPQGTEYVVGTPPASPVLRMLKQALYDKLIVPENGRVEQVLLFDDCKFFPDHTLKTSKDTNMTCSGQLGYPLEFDLSWIDLMFEKFAHPDDVKRVLRGLTFKWIRGQCVPWLRVTLSGFEPLLLTEGVLSDNLKQHVSGQLAGFKESGIWTRYRVNVRTPDGHPQRLCSSESFRVEVASPDGGIGELHGPVHLKVLLGDQLFAQL